MYSNRNDYVITRNLRELLEEKPWLVQYVTNPHARAWLIIEYWRRYDDLKITAKHRNHYPTDSQAILEAAFNLLKKER